MTNVFQHYTNLLSHYEQEGNFMTQILSIHQKNPDKRRIRKVIEIIDGEGIILAPSETGYCYIGNASNYLTREKFLKLRPEHPKNKPFSIFCKNISQVSKISHLDTKTFRIVTKAWPGPYTFVLPSSKNTPKTTAGAKKETVGVRISNYPIINDIINELEYPLLVTSVTDEFELIAQNYFEDFLQENCWWTNASNICKHTTHGQINLAIESEEIIPIKVSTVIDLTEQHPILLRDGGWDLSFLNV